METAKFPSLTLYTWLAACFVTALIVANLLGAYLLEVPALNGSPITFSAGILCFPLTFLLTDLLNEFYGAAGARQVTWLGFGMSLLTFGFLWVAQHLPVSESTVLSQLAFMDVSSQFTGMVVASLTAYLVGQFFDIALFGWFKRLTGGSRLLWLRATGSTVLSQLFDSILVGFIAFWGELPVPVITGIVFANYGVKLVVSIGITPLLYLGYGLLNQFLSRSQTETI